MSLPKWLPIALLLVPALARADGGRVKVVDFDEDVLEGTTVAKDDRAAAPEVWARLGKGDYAAARQGFAAALDKSPTERAHLLHGWLLASVLAGGDPDRIAKELEAFKPSADERTLFVAQLDDLTRAYAGRDRAHAVRAWQAQKTLDASAAVALHLELARDADADLDWKTVDAELGAALAAATKGIAPDLESATTALEEEQTALASMFLKNRDRNMGAAARALAKRYLALPGAPHADAVKKSAVAVDALLQDLDNKNSPTVMTDVDKSLLRRFIRRHTDETVACYQRALLADPKLEGKISLRLTIDPNGKVRSAQGAEKGLGLGAVATCVADHAKTWRFPTGSATITITYPFVFHASTP